MNQENLHHNNSEELPMPVTGSKTSFESQHAKQVETGASGAVVGSSDGAVTTTSSHASVISSSVQDDARGTGPHVSTPHIADDTDLIEKEWIESAKRIVANTKGDPHAQSEGLTIVKKDYKKKRFNVDDDLGAVS